MSYIYQGHSKLLEDGVPKLIVYIQYIVSREAWKMLPREKFVKLDARRSP